MYAMLTGCLPYTVEPFNITALHAKMLENKMNPIPNHLSPGEFSMYPVFSKIEIWGGGGGGGMCRIRGERNKTKLLAFVWS